MRLREGVSLLWIPYSRWTLFLWSACHREVLDKYRVSRCQLIWPPSCDPELRLMDEGVAIFSCHFLCNIKLVSANSHLLNFSYFFTYDSFPWDFYNMFKLKLWHCFLKEQSKVCCKVGHKDWVLLSAPEKVQVETNMPMFYCFGKSWGHLPHGAFRWVLLLYPQGPLSLSEFHIPRVQQSSWHGAMLNKYWPKNWNDSIVT